MTNDRTETTTDADKTGHTHTHTQRADDAGKVREVRARARARAEYDEYSTRKPREKVCANEKWRHEMRQRKSTTQGGGILRVVALHKINIIFLLLLFA